MVTRKEIYDILSEEAKDLTQLQKGKIADRIVKANESSWQTAHFENPFVGMDPDVTFCEKCRSVTPYATEFCSRCGRKMVEERKA